MFKATPYAVATAVALGLATPIAAEAQTADRGGTLSARAATYSTLDLQRALDRAGYDPGPLDGVMGPSTRRALESFQRDQNLTVTGTPTAGVYRALERQGYLTARSAPPSPDTGQTAELREVERKLDRAGYDPGPVDGTIDWRTRSALRDLQQDAGLAATGTINQRTLAALNERTEVPAQAQAPAGANLVEDVQLALRARGNETVQVTGELDAQTRAAIRAWQREAGLPVTGQPSSELLAMIETGRTPTRTAEQDRGALVRDIEIALRNKGYTTGPINEVAEPETMEAVRQYQEQRGLWPRDDLSAELLADIRASDVQAPPAEQQAQREDQEPQDPTQQLFRLLGERALEQIQNR